MPDNTNPDIINEKKQFTRKQSYGNGDISVDYDPDVGTAGALVWTDESNGQVILEKRIGGNVRVLNGNFSLNGGSIQSVNNINGANDNFGIRTSGTGTGYVYLYDTANGQRILTASEGGNVDIPNGRLAVDGDDIRLKGINDGAHAIQYQTGIDGPVIKGYSGVRLYGYNSSQPILDAHDNGTVEILNGPLNVGSSGIAGSAGDIGVQGEVRFNNYYVAVSRGDIGAANSLDLKGYSEVNLYSTNNDHTLLEANNDGNVDIPNGHLEVSGGVEHQQRAADPSTTELASGQSMTYTSDGSTDCTGAAGDLVYAVNDAGTIKTSVIAAVSNAT